MLRVGHGRCSILALGALALALLGTAGCDGGSAPTAAPPAPPPETTDGPGDYRPPRDVCGVVDFSPLTPVLGPLSNAPENTVTGADPKVSSGAQCRQYLGGTGVFARAVVHCSAWSGVAKAIEMHKYARETAAKDAVGGVTDVPDLGRQAFRYRAPDSVPWHADLRLTVRDSNLDCELKAQTDQVLTPDQTATAYQALTEIARTAAPRLR
ncbi:hypothetical protein ACFXAF_11010 [Kitasatospora sp. NPDC059463]|uniref:hypothetical protein n=1 Tax=unclassified Kitasatospora TaxID=2633591 RepID=UPI00367FEB29